MASKKAAPETQKTVTRKTGMAMHSPNTLMMLERFNTIRRQILRIKRKAKTADLGMNVKEDLQEALTRLHCARRNMKAYFSERNSASRRRVRSHHQVNGNRPIEDFQEDDDEDVVGVRGQGGQEGCG